MDIGVQGKTYIITGGSSGLGFATAQVLTSEGANVVISSRQKKNVDNAVMALGKSAVGVAVDNADPSAPERLFRAAATAFPQCSVGGLLISVGGPKRGSFFETTEDDWREAFDSVFLGALRIARYAGENLIGNTSIGMVLSTSVWSPVHEIAISNGLRPGLAMTVKALSDELSPSGVRVFGVSPGLIKTARLEGTTSRAKDVPLRRYGQPNEFGRVSAFLLSPASSYVTGCVVPIDGGLVRSL